MTNQRKWLIGLGVGTLVVVGGGLLAASYIPSDEELAQTAATRLSKALGVNVSVGTVHWQLLPAAVVVVNDITIAQPEPITVRQLSLVPNIGALWRRSVQFDSAELDGASVPQKSLRGLGASGAAPSSLAASAASADTAFGSFRLDELPLARFVFKNVTWISRTNVPAVYEGEIDFDAAWRPRTAQARRPGAATAADMALTRMGQQDRWTTHINVGGGTANGELQLASQTNGRLSLSGKLQVRNVEVASALESFNRRSVLSGKAVGETTLAAQGDSVAELAQSLRTQTPFTMGPSKLLRFDLDKAIRTLGKDHAGQTAVDSVTGELDTQNTAEGMVINFKAIKATSGSLSASGNARLLNRVIDAEFAVDLVDGIVGVPLKVTGPLNKVAVSVPASALAGAAVGTAVLPGIGTAIGARIGAAIGKLFGTSPPTGAKTVPPAQQPTR